MHKKSMWWFFVLFFGLTIGAIQLLGWWTRQASAQTPISPSRGDPYATPAAARHFHGETKHWRAMIMQQ